MHLVMGTKARFGIVRNDAGPLRSMASLAPRSWLGF